MSALIEIKKELIGTENVNSVNSRELHKNLQVKKKFADWIKTQINTLGLDENIDYLTVPLKGNGGRFASIDYIITLDTAKHIAMASRTDKGREVRKYFIEAEKELKSIKPEQTDLLPAILEMAKVNQQIVKSNQEIVANLTDMNKGLHQMLIGFANVQQDIKAIKSNLQITSGNINMLHFQTRKIKEKQEGLHPVSLDFIRDSIDTRAKQLSDGTKTNTQSITRAIYSYINNEYGVSSYYYLKDSDFESVMTTIKNIDIKA